MFASYLTTSEKTRRYIVKARKEQLRFATGQQRRSLWENSRFLCVRPRGPPRQEGRRQTYVVLSGPDFITFMAITSTRAENGSERRVFHRSMLETAEDIQSRRGQASRKQKKCRSPAFRKFRSQWRESVDYPTEMAECVGSMRTAAGPNVDGGVLGVT